MTIKLYILDHVHTVGLGCDSYTPNIATMDPNNIIYFFGVIISLLIQTLVIYDYFFNYTICSQFFIWSKWIDVQYFVKKYSLKPAGPITIDTYFWPTALPILFLESFFCFIAYYFFNKSFLFISVFVWTISFLMSFFSITVINIYIRGKEDLMVGLRIRESKMVLLEKEIEKLAIKWRIEEMEKHGEKFDESIINKRIEDYRTVKMRVIDEILNTKNTFLIETLQNVDIQYEGTPMEWFLTPTHQNIVNILLYFYYLYICCQDSVDLYNSIYPWFDYPLIGEVHMPITQNPEVASLSLQIIQNIIFFGF